MLNIQELRAKMIEAIRLTGTVIENDQLEIVDRGMPHKPSGLPAGKMGIYTFIYQDHFLKIGKAGPNSDARFRSQHYNPLGSQSNLAKSILNDIEFASQHISIETVGEWIRQNTKRVDLFINASLGIFVLNYFEAFLHLMYQPKYEGFDNQRKIIGN
ncbi:hypothetical protein [Cohnella sp.]|uniref:hypothetical protein n=1 Tax=Cohnella sp. TaxID=1883426 RepID=UPI0035654A33